MMSSLSFHLFTGASCSPSPILLLCSVRHVQGCLPPAVSWLELLGWGCHGPVNSGCCPFQWDRVLWDLLSISYEPGVSSLMA